MSVLPSGAAQSLAGLAGTERPREATKKDKREEARAKGRALAPDELTLGSDLIDAAEAIRSLKDNTQEESKEERQGQAGYMKSGRGPGDARPAIDVEG